KDDKAKDDKAYGDSTKDEKSWDAKGDDAKKDEEKGKGYEGKGYEGYGEEYVYATTVKIDKHAKPGEYELKGSCGTGKLVIVPTGSVNGGDGGVAGTGLDGGLAAGGVGMLGAAALGGLFLMRRPRTDGPLA
ncbi:hypothetical protein AB0J86_37030, partial [Micromonospora sp. NPDC049559]